MSNTLKKQICIVAFVVLAGIMAVSGGGFADYANKPFFQKLWPILQVACIVGFICGWLYFAAKEKGEAKNGN